MESFFFQIRFRIIGRKPKNIHSNIEYWSKFNVLDTIGFGWTCSTKYKLMKSFLFNYASSSSGDAYRDRQVTPNFELWVEIFLCADMFPCEDSKTVSVCPYPEKKSPYFRQYQSYISNWYINGKVFTSTTAKNPKIWFF